MRTAFAALLALAAQTAVPAQETGRRQPLFAMKERPSLRVGDWLRADLRVKIQTDFRGALDDREIEDGLFDLRRARLGLEGRLSRDLEFEVEAEAHPVEHQLRDAFINYRRLRRLQFRAGKFKMPFGRDQLTGPTNLDFIYRSRIGARLAPARDLGVMAHGKLFEKGVEYQAGLFRHDGENAESKDNRPTGSATFAARLVGLPAAYLPLPDLFKTLEIGAAVTQGKVTEGLHSLHGATALGDSFFSRMYVNGTRRRTGLEAAWAVGRLGLAGEYMSAREERAGQGIILNDLPDLISRGWYASATYSLVKAKAPQKDGQQPRGLRALVPGMRRGEVELAARYEQMRFAGESSPGLASRSPRAAHVLGNNDRAITMGVNWRANHYTRFQFNLIRETIEDPQRSPTRNGQPAWSLVGRMQFVI